MRTMTSAYTAGGSFHGRDRSAQALRPTLSVCQPRCRSVAGCSGRLQVMPGPDQHGSDIGRERHDTLAGGHVANDLDCPRSSHRWTFGRSNQKRFQTWYRSARSALTNIPVQIDKRGSITWEHAALARRKNAILQRPIAVTSRCPC